MATHRRPDGRTLGLLGLAVTLFLTFAAAAQQTERFDDRVRDSFSPATMAISMRFGEAWRS